MKSTSYRPNIICVRMTDEELARLKILIAAGHPTGREISRSQYIRERVFAPAPDLLLGDVKREMKNIRVEIHYMTERLKRSPGNTQGMERSLQDCTRHLDHIAQDMEAAYGSDSTEAPEGKQDEE